MNASPAHTDAPDDLDRLLAGFFKAQVPHPWPNAPLPPVAQAEPSVLATARAAEPPGRRDTAVRARVTLAASVALMLGTCWYLSSGYTPGQRGPRQAAPTGPSLFDGSDANDKGVLPQIQKNKAEDPPKMDPGKFE
jgi:hypothetical protein